MKFKEIWGKEGFKQFVVKTIVFVTLFSLLPVILSHLVLMTAIGNEMFLPFSLVDLAKSALFTIFLFFMLTRKRIVSIKEYKFRLEESIKFGSFSFIFLILFFLLRFYVKLNYPFIPLIYWFFVLLFVISVFLFVWFMILGIFSKDFVKKFIKDFKKELLISTIILVLYYLLIIYIQKFWVFFSKIVAFLVFTLLKINFQDVIVRYGRSPFISLKGFGANIGQPCSGIDSLLLFSSLFLLILFLDWYILNKKKMAILFILGAIGIFLINVLRIYLLFIFGVFISKDFAIGMFHSNVGWLLFIIYFIGFWWIMYPWVKRK
ncbi:MAG: archaeosortase/exosortase family protein [archaeon]